MAYRIFTLSVSNVREQATNKQYNTIQGVCGIQGLLNAVKFDHTEGLFRKGERSNENFIKAACLIMDCDNEKTDNPSDWLTPERLSERLSGVEFYTCYSRNHMRQKKDKSPRPRFHIYFPLDNVITNTLEIRRYKEAILRAIPEFDAGAKDAARFIFGVENPEVKHFDGDKDIITFLDALPTIEPDIFTQTQSKPKVTADIIPVHKRNVTLYQRGIELIPYYADNEEARQAFKNECEKCEEKLDDSELWQIWHNVLNSDAKKLADLARSVGDKDKFIAEAQKLSNNSGLIHDVIKAVFEGQPKAPELVPTPQAQQAKSFIMDAQYLAESFESDITHFQRYSNRKTGFSNIDEKLTLYPGLYVVGAISSLGKTTFCLQMSDQLAQAGEHVLYFAFEQTRFELVSKSLARLCQPEDLLLESLPTAIQIRQGRTCPEVREAMQKYSEIGKRKAVVECDFQTDINAVISTVEAYIKTYAVKPVVFVDYLQLIRSANPKLTNTKDIVDENIRALKLLQMQNELVMFVVSSLNRANYSAPIDFESFKESGSIEFTADVIMGLQLAIMNARLFESGTNHEIKKRKAVKKAKTQTPRYIELCILKNRYGVSNESFYFRYYPKFDQFEPTTQEITQEAVANLIASIPDTEGKKREKI